MDDHRHLALHPPRHRTLTQGAPVSYNTIAKIATDAHLRARIMACIAEQDPAAHVSMWADRLRVHTSTAGGNTLASGSGRAFTHLEVVKLRA